MALEVFFNEKVIILFLKWISLFNIICLVSKKLAIIDVDSDKFMVALVPIKAVIPMRIYATIPIHYSDILVIENTAHPESTYHKGRHMDDICQPLFLLHTIKNMNYTENSMVTLNENWLTDHIQNLKFHEMIGDTFKQKKQKQLPLVVIITLKLKYNLADINVVITLMQLDKLVQNNTYHQVIPQHDLRKLADVFSRQWTSSIQKHQYTWHSFSLFYPPQDYRKCFSDFTLPSNRMLYASLFSYCFFTKPYG